MRLLLNLLMKPKSVFFFFYQEIQKTGSRLLLSACDGLRSSPQIGAGSRTAVLNTLSWERTEVVEGLEGELGTQTCGVFTFAIIVSKSCLQSGD